MLFIKSGSFKCEFVPPTFFCLLFVESISESYFSCSSYESSTVTFTGLASGRRYRNALLYLSLVVFPVMKFTVWTWISLNKGNINKRVTTNKIDWTSQKRCLLSFTSRSLGGGVNLVHTMIDVMNVNKS